MSSCRATGSRFGFPTHIACNSGYRLVDEKIGQLIALRYRKVPRNTAHRRLKFAFLGGNVTWARSSISTSTLPCGAGSADFTPRSIVNPLASASRGSLVTPFPKAQIIGGRPVFAPLLVQHSLFVQTIKSNPVARQPRPDCVQQGEDDVRMRLAAGGQWRALDVHLRSRYLRLEATSVEPAPYRRAAVPAFT